MKKISILLFFFAILSQAANAQNILINGRKAENSPHSIVRDSPCDTILSISHYDLYPTGIAFDGTYLWCNNSFPTSFIYRFDLFGQFVDSIASPGQDSFGGGGGGMDFDGTHILICVEQDGILYKLDPVTGVVVNEIALPNNGLNPSDPNNYGITYDGTHLWHTEYSTPSDFQSTLYKLDAKTGAVLDSFVLDNADLAIKFIHGDLYGIDPQLEILHKIDTTNGHYLSSEPWCIRYTLGLTVADNHIWASDLDVFGIGTNSVYQFDSQFLSGTHTALPEITCSLYPNPVSDWVRIQLGNVPDSKLSMEIVNVIGQNMLLLLDEQTVSPGQDFDFDLNGLPAGVYMLKIKSATAQSLKALIKL